jgi:hypothetical protein
MYADVPSGFMVGQLRVQISRTKRTKKSLSVHLTLAFLTGFLQIRRSVLEACYFLRQHLGLIVNGGKKIGKLAY